jgi:hypothetical protein
MKEGNPMKVLTAGDVSKASVATIRTGKKLSFATRGKRLA